MKTEIKGQFPSKNCDCHIQHPYGFVPEADCPDHDTQQFIDFLCLIREEKIGVFWVQREKLSKR